jgi:hypothetical protein
MPTKLLLIGLLAIAALNGCASDKALDYRDRLIGMPVTELVKCAGAPGREVTEGSVTVFTYSLESSSVIPGSSAIVKGQCDGSVTIEADKVTNVTYRTTHDYGLCEPIFRACVSPA